MKRMMFVAALVVTVAACNQQKPEPESKTVEYFKQHPNEIDQVKKDCDNKGISPLADSADARTCNAVRTAIRQRNLGIQ